ncbi:MAG: flavin reductase family protein [Pseudonocardia sp.]|nr:flavin reductase family protein [Pseudonocardia sp.]
MTAIDPRAFRDTVGHYAAGITIIASVHCDEPVGFTCQSFYSVSLDPPLVSFSVKHDSTSYPRIRETGRFAVNVLARPQQELSSQFSRSGADKWAGVRWSRTPKRNPAIDDCLVWLDCTIEDEHPAGDHLIVIGRVEGAGPPERGGGEPLLYFRGGYR